MPAAVPEDVLKRVEALESERKQLLNKVQSLESQLSEATTGKESLSLEAECLRTFPASFSVKPKLLADSFVPLFVEVSEGERARGLLCMGSIEMKRL